MKRILRLTPEYQCWPLWDQSPGKGDNIDHETLPISENLKKRLTDWSEVHERTLNEDYPPDSKFASEEERERWLAEGRSIRDDLQRELGPDYVVQYFKDGKGD